jgi:5-methylcytosine-specific restriction endonuclease McrA
MTIHQNQFPALVLNADFRVKQAFPLSTLNWQDAIKGVIGGKYIRVADYEHVVRTQRSEFALPSVIAMTQYVPFSNKVPFNRQNIWLRDEGVCAYCQCTLTTAEMTFDHVVPQVAGGKTEWTNIVCACQPCNGAKAAKSVAKSGLTLHARPYEPTAVEIARKARASFQIAHETWLDYIYWEQELLPA